MEAATPRGWFKGHHAWRGAESRNRQGRHRGRRYVRCVIRNLSVSEEGEKGQRRVCGIYGCFLRFLEAKDEE